MFSPVYFSCSLTPSLIPCLFFHLPLTDVAVKQAVFSSLLAFADFYLTLLSLSWFSLFFTLPGFLPLCFTYVNNLNIVWGLWRKKGSNDLKEYSKASQTHNSSMKMEEKANELWSVVMQCVTTVCQFLWKLQEKVDHSQVTQLASLNKNICF